MLTYLRWELHSFPDMPEIVEILNDDCKIDPDFSDAASMRLPVECLLGIEETIDAIGFWEWEREYFDMNVLDGTQWSLRIRGGSSGERQKSSEGSNLFPRGWEAIYRDMRKVRNEVLGYVG